MMKNANTFLEQAFKISFVKSCNRDTLKNVYNSKQYSQSTHKWTPIVKKDSNVEVVDLIV